MWYNLAIHFVSRGIEFHQQLSVYSFEFTTDDEGNEYCTINHETKQKNHQGGTSWDEAYADKRMYATYHPNCPVAMLRKLPNNIVTLESPVYRSNIIKALGI